MLLGEIADIDSFQYDSKLYQILQNIDKYKNEKKHDSKIIISEDSYLSRISFEGKEESECYFESHQKAIDIHYVLEGSERVCLTPTDQLEIVTPYDGEQDIQFLKGNTKNEIILTPENFLVCYPEDGHKVGMYANVKSKQITKLVGKIKYLEEK